MSFAHEGSGEARHRAFAMDMERGFDEVTDEWRVIDGVDDTGGDGGETGPAVDASEGVVKERAGALFEVVGEELSLVGGHVYAGGALALAGLAGEAEIERFPYLFVLPLVGEDFALHQLPQEMGAASGRVELFAGGHEAGAHGSGILFAAGAYAYTAQSCGGEGSPVF